MRARRVELAAGIASALVTALALALLLVAPIVPACARDVPNCPPADLRFVALSSSAVSPGALAYIVGISATLLLGSAAAIADATSANLRAAGRVLWVLTALALVGCALSAQGAGAVYVPAVLALLIATYASLRGRARRRGEPSDTVSPTARDGLS